VTPFRKSKASNNDRNDAEAIATAARQGNMRFVPVKTTEQQARLAWHRVREGYNKESLAVSNRLRGLLSEFGVVVPQGPTRCARCWRIWQNMIYRPRWSRCLANPNAITPPFEAIVR
jgi:transposase